MYYYLFNTLYCLHEILIIFFTTINMKNQNYDNSFLVPITIPWLASVNTQPAQCFIREKKRDRESRVTTAHESHRVYIMTVRSFIHTYMYTYMYYNNTRIDSAHNL